MSGPRYHRVSLPCRWRPREGGRRPPEHLHRLSKRRLASAFSTGRLPEAIKLLEERRVRSLVSVSHLDTLGQAHNLANAYSR